MSGTIISLASIRRVSADKSRPCSAPTPAGGAMEDPALWERIKDHPCYNEDAHHDFARVHVAVAPACNIQCNYCNRKYDCANESRPGVVSETLSPEQAALKVAHIAARLPQLSVVGIAGPGDALANAEKTFRTFELIAGSHPHLKLCLSTNGLALLEHVPTLKSLGVDHVTVTINMVDPEVGQYIYPWIYYQKRRWHGRDAATILHERQMLGLEALVSAGMLVKVNSVLIPGINDAHLVEVNAAIRSRGAFLHNIIPLISDPAHGTVFGLSGQRAPSSDELHSLQERLSGRGARLMRHCRQCRADAVGLLGESCDSAFTLDRLPATAPVVDPEPQRAYRVHIAEEWRQRQDMRVAARRRIQAAGLTAPRRIAVATQGSGRINLHFGKAREFLVYEVDHSGLRLLGPRRIDHYCQGGFGDDDALERVIAALHDVDTLLVAKVGACPRERLEQAGLTIRDDFAQDYIENALAACVAEAGQHRNVCG